MEKPHGSQNRSENLALEAGQREIECSIDVSCQCPTLGYEPAASSDGEDRINKAFDILFQEVMNIRKSNNPHEINRHLRPGVHRPAGRGTNN
jgi:hypothetical protein